MSVHGRTGLLVYRTGRAVRHYGLVGAVGRGARFVLDLPRRRRGLRREHAFDALHDVDTAGIVHLHALRIESEHAADGVRYEASDPEWFRHLIAGLPFDHRRFVFIDIGAGKGRALLLASEYPFKRIIGVEFAPELATVAVANVRRFRSSDRRCSDIEVQCIDAVEFVLPEEPCLLYLYNPFAERVLRQVLANVRRSLAAVPRPIVITIAGAVAHSALLEAGFVPLPDAPSEELSQHVFVDGTR